MGKRKPAGAAASGRPAKSSRVTPQSLAIELRRVLARGLPATAASAGERLPHLRSVLARSVHPEDALSRLDALNLLLPKLIDQLADETYRDAARILFGLGAGTRRTTLTARRRQAADLLGYHPDHFRTDVEQEVLRAVAEVVYRDLLRYRSRVKRSVQSLEPTGDTPKLSEADVTAEEELISRIWQHVYGLRAEVIAHLRLSREPGYQGQVEDHRQAALRVHDDLRRLLGEYVETYGPMIRHGEAEFAAEALERLAGWRG